MLFSYGYHNIGIHGNEEAEKYAKHLRWISETDNSTFNSPFGNYRALCDTLVLFLIFPGNFKCNAITQTILSLIDLSELQTHISCRFKTFFFQF